MDIDVFFAGTAGSVPTAGRGMPAVLVRRGGERLLFDCGEGTQRQLLRSVGLADLDAIFLTHFHLDHWLGLPGLLKTFDLRDRERPLTLHGPHGLHGLMRMVRPLHGRLGYELRTVELEPGEPVRLEDAAVVPVEVDHRARAHAYVLIEDQRPGRFDEEAARRLGVPEGPAFGMLQRGQPVDGVMPEQVLGPPRPGRKLVISGDTRPSAKLQVAAHDADVLVHEATFLHEDRERAAQTGHSTARQAAELAAQASVRLLALVHVSTRYAARDVRDEARASFGASVVPRDFDTIDVPLPERGEPAVVRWEERSAEASEPGARVP